MPVGQLLVLYLLSLAVGAPQLALLLWLTRRRELLFAKLLPAWTVVGASLLVVGRWSNSRALQIVGAIQISPMLSGCLTILLLALIAPVVWPFVRTRRQPR